jgi:nicotinate phosphoribosyltransferase
MVDIVNHVLNLPRDKYIITSRMQNDFYKSTMKKFIFKYAPDVDVTFKFIVRGKGLPLALIIPEEWIRREFDHARTLKYTEPDLAYLGGMRVEGKVMFEDYAYLERLRTSKLPRYTLERVGNDYEMTFKGNWFDVTDWEMISMSVINGLKSRAITDHMSKSEVRLYYARATDKLWRKLQLLRDTTSISYIDFGLRRHESFEWEEISCEMSIEIMKERFTGISTVSLAQKFGMEAKGTNAHELVMVLVALARVNGPGAMLDAIYDVLRKWEPLFFGKLLVILPDTYGTQMFFDNMPKDLAEHVAHVWPTVRGDSGGMIAEGERALAFWRKWKVDLKKEKKVYLPSDGLDVSEMQEIDRHFKGIISTPCGWGTGLTNDFKGIHPRMNEQAVLWGTPIGMTWDEICGGQSMVCKVHKVNGIYAVKFSNNILKATGDPDEVEYYKGVLGYKDMVSQKVFV